MVSMLAFRLAERSISDHLNELVVAVELDTEEALAVELPAQLMALLQRQTSIEAPSHAIGQCLAWLICFHYLRHAVS